MIKARFGDLLVLGLSAENIRLLQAGFPILFDGAQVGLPGRISIVAGETEDAIVADFRQAMLDAATERGHG